VLKKAARLDRGEKSPTNGAGRVVNMNVEITRNQQTTREGKRNLQQVREFVQEDVCFASRLVLENNNKVEPG
jgi:hypothetical protein